MPIPQRNEHKVRSSVSTYGNAVILAILVKSDQWSPRARRNIIHRNTPALVDCSHQRCPNYRFRVDTQAPTGLGPGEFQGVAVAGGTDSGRGLKMRSGTDQHLMALLVKNYYELWVGPRDWKGDDHHNLQCIALHVVKLDGARIEMNEKQRRRRRRDGGIPRSRVELLY